MYIINHLSQFLKQPTNVRWQGVKCVLRYLSGTKHLGLLITPSEVLHISAYYDADWASNVDDRKSVAAYCVYLGNTLVSWSSTKFEYRALAHAFAEVIWLKQWLIELGVSNQPKPILWCDNISAGALATNPIFHVTTKHIKIDVHFVPDKVL